MATHLPAPAGGKSATLAVMSIDPRAGQPATDADLVDVAALVTAYYTGHPDVAEPAQQVAFGTSGHRGSSLDLAFNEDHIAATSQAICEHRAAAGIAGPLFLGRDTHGLSEPAWSTALEVFAANDVTVLVDDRDRYTPDAGGVARDPAAQPRPRRHATRADGVVVTPSHNPPRDGGFKYNPPDGGPAGSDITGWVQDRANEILRDGLKDVRRVPLARARAADDDVDLRLPRRRTSTTCPSVLDLDAVRAAPACGSVPTRSAARASTTGRRSPSGTGST